MPEAKRSAARDRARFGHGWWPYLLPYLLYVGLGEFASVFGERGWLPLLAIKPLGVAVLIVWFARRGAYPELRGFAAERVGISLDVAVGVASGLLWMAPYVLVPALRPAPDGAFDAARAGAQWAGLALGLRFAGYVLVTPVFEELFIRSFAMRYAEVFDTGRDFRDVPIAHYSPKSLLISSVLFTLGHAFWEWWVALPWVVLTSLWFYRRGHLGSVIVVHAAANATILLSAVLASGVFPDGQGGTLSLWFFV